MLVLPADRRASAFRRFPRGCGRHHNAATGLPSRYPLPPTAAAATATKPPLPNPSPARAANKTAPSQPKRTRPAAAPSGAEGSSRGVGNGRKAAAAVTARRVSAVRRYPPGCGRGVAVSKPPPSMGEAGAGKPTAAVGNGEAMARACGREVMLRASALDHAKFNSNALDDAEFNSNGGMKNGGGGDAVAQEEGGGKPWVVTGPMAVPFLPWAQHGKRSQRPNA
ncbi:hypothetical protein BAE44_0004636 [Dichanthelium oligosanthes]|uniref:Uncharacterized protein n=1 Tax=Dichanthelium oligosanthes TaxID=888268 RepID=A0A1E5WAJ0_9POAL|nr:hypothetical protein BAE44_0004636 [Dichanthelium oligosanthes]